MSRGPGTFKQRDVTQALKAAAAAGMKVTHYEIDRQGKIAIFTADGALGGLTDSEATGPATRIVL